MGVSKKKVYDEVIGMYVTVDNSQERPSITNKSIQIKDTLSDTLDAYNNLLTNIELHMKRENKDSIDLKMIKLITKLTLAELDESIEGDC